MILAWSSFLSASQNTLVVEELKWIPTTPTSIPMVLPQVVIPQTPLSTQLDYWISQSNWPPQYWSTVRRIVLCESGGVVGIDTNPPHVGLMQANVNYWGYPQGGPVGELNQGYQIYLIQGWRAWSCY